MFRKTPWIMTLVVCTLWLRPALAETGPGDIGIGNGGSIGGGHGRRTYSVGTQGGLPWSTIDLKAAREAKKPIILYVYDEKIKKENHTVQFFEAEIFSDPGVQKTLKELFTCICVPSTAEWLAPVFITRAQGGAAVFLMTFDGSIHRFWNVGNRPQVNEFAEIAKNVAISNPKVVERFEKEKPLNLKFPNGQPVDLKPVAGEVRKEGATVYSIAPDEAARLDVVKRLAVEIATSTKAGEKLKAWLTLGSKKEELVIQTADAKILSLNVQGNVLPIKWDKIEKEEIYDLSKNIAGENPQRLLLAAEMAMALGHADEAIAILAKARVLDPNTAPQADTLAGRIQKTVQGGEAAQ